MTIIHNYTPNKSGIMGLKLACYNSNVKPLVDMDAHNRYGGLWGWSYHDMKFALKDLKITFTPLEWMHLNHTDNPKRYLKTVIDSNCTMLIRVKLIDIPRGVSRNRGYLALNPSAKVWLYASNYDEVYYNTLSCIDPCDARTFLGKEYDMGPIIKSLIKHKTDGFILNGDSYV